MTTKYYYTFILVFLASFAEMAQAQTFGNEWINPSQQYYKIPVAETGMYRISEAELTAAGITGIDPRNLQLYHRGQEQAIYVAGEADGSLDAGDYLEFYGQKNDGSLDLELYKSPGTRVNPFYNLYSDTTAYFLTWTLDNTPGKRIEEVDIASNAALETYQWHEDLQVFHSTFSTGQNYAGGEIFLSVFDTGEGWVGSRFNSGQTASFTFNINDLQSPPSPFIKPQIECSMVGAGAGTYRVDVYVGPNTSSMRYLATVSPVGFYQKFTLYRDIELSDMNNNGQCIIQLRVITGAIRPVYNRLRYPQNYNLNLAYEQYLKLPINTNRDTSFVRFSNVPSAMELYDITNPNTLKRILTNNLSGSTEAGITGTQSNERRLYLPNPSRKTVINIEAVSMQNFDPSADNYLLITHSKLRQAAGEHADIVQAYADYRASTEGGAYDVLLVNIDALYNHFSYGERTPLAIRRFADFYYRNGDPEYIFLIGKSVGLPDSYNPLNIRTNPSHAALDLVPNAGFPSSDIELVARLGNTGLPEPGIAIGRLSATTPEQILNYFNKVKEHENTPPMLWRKNIIHLTGGNGEFEQALFRNYADNLKIVAEGDYFGGKVSTTTKSTSNPVELINISEQVNEGVGWIMFFGHSTPNFTDLEIGRATDPGQGYDNAGRYPLMLMNGCQLAAIFSSNYTLAEDWMNAPNKGSIAFIGHSYFGYSIPLRDYSNRLYRLVYEDLNYTNQTIGKILKENIRRNVSITNTVDRALAEQMVLQGDPAVKIYPINQPDYEITANQLYLESFDNNPVTAVADSFQVKMIVSNLGTTSNQPFRVSVKRYFADGSLPITYESPNSYSPISYQDTISFTLYREESINAFGLNRFEVTIDYLDEIAEANETNNTAILEFFMPTIGVQPLHLQEYSIAFQQPVKLSAMVSTLSPEERDFRFEIDTVSTFDSPAKLSTTVRASLTPTWEINLLSDNDQDSTVYYWRVNYADAVNDPNTLWGESSFTYIKASPPGWSQSQVPQFRKANLENIVLNEAQQRWDFTKLSKRISVYTFGDDYTGADYTDVEMLYDGLPLVFNGRCNDNVMVAIAFEKDTGLPYLVLAANGCGRFPPVANFYGNAALQNFALNNYLNAVNDGDYVLFFSIGGVNFSNWSNTHKQAFANIGGNPTIYNQLETGHPYIILGQKGAAPATAREVISGSITAQISDDILLNTTIDIPRNNGKIRSTRIGPADDWKEVISDIRTSGNDIAQLDIYGIDANGNETPIFLGAATPVQSLETIDAALYPYLRLELRLRDDTEQTPAQLKKWLVLFDGLPDGFIDVEAVGAASYAISDRQQGEPLSIPFAFSNLSSLSFDSDSLEVRYTLVNQQTLVTTQSTFKIAAPAALATTRFNIALDTHELGGEYQMRVDVNTLPVPEMYFENNTFLVDFNIIEDNLNPILEVAFDGRKIMDGDIVSPNPQIHISLRDNNAYLTRDPADGTGIFASLRRPCEGCDFEEVDLSQPGVVLVEEGELTTLEFQLNNLEDGIYTLRVQGEDAVGNRAAEQPHSINFEVINESTVTNVYPYPNPFSTSTRFVFTLTGEDIPDEMKIQIMTVTGKVVREITQDEIGAIYIGNNMTEYAWDGRDEFGDQLANGVYLYRVLMRKGGEGFKHRATAGDRAFKNGYGKLYIAR